MVRRSFLPFKFKNIEYCGSMKLTEKHSISFPTLESILYGPFFIWTPPWELLKTQNTELQNNQWNYRISKNLILMKLNHMLAL